MSSEPRTQRNDGALRSYAQRFGLRSEARSSAFFEAYHDPNIGGLREDEWTWPHQIERSSEVYRSDKAELPSSFRTPKRFA